MLRVASIIRKPAVKSDLVVDTVVLDYEARQQKSLKFHGEGGTVAEFSSEKAANLKDGDAFRLEDGKLIAVRAATEKLFKVTAENPLRLVRLAWQLGNQHVPVEAAADALFIGIDPELEELIRGQGCSFDSVERPFNPEQAAHDHGCCHHAHEHHHHHGHGEGCGCGGHGKHGHHEHRHDEDHDHHHHDHGHDRRHGDEHGH